MLLFRKSSRAQKILVKKMAKKTLKDKKNESIKAKKQSDCKSISVKGSTSSRMHDVWTAILTILGLIVIYIVSMLHTNNAEPLQAFLSSQAGAEGLYANAIALVATAYNKATSHFEVKGKVFLLSLFGNFLVAHIFAQAIFMVYPEVKLYAEFMRTEWFSIVGVLLFFGIIFAINCSEGMQEYSKQPITKK